MIEINGKQLCENCFEETSAEGCPHCGYSPASRTIDPTVLAPGSILADRYVVGQIIGKGGFGITYLTFDALTEKKVAVKEYFPYGIAARDANSSEISVSTEEDAKAFKLGEEKFYNEAKIISKFNGNPNIAGVYDAFHENGTSYFVMEYLKGRTLKAYVRDHGPLSAPQAIYIAQSVAGALVVIHSAKVLHRDISPDNVILCENGNIKLIDFGSARQVVAEYSQNFSVILKPGFAPLEQYRKNGKQGPWTDVYSLGAMLYFMLTGDIPEDSMARFDDDDTFGENRFELDPQLWEIISKAASLNIEDRYRDAYEMKQALDSVPIAPEPIAVPSDGTYEEPANFIKANGRTSSPITGKSISITVKQKNNFFKRHLRTIIEAVCLVAFMTVIILIVIKAYTPHDDNTSVSDNGNSTGSDSTSTTNQSSGSDEVYTPGPVGYLIENGFNKPFFSVKDDKDKELYAYICRGLLNGDRDISVPSLTYTVADAMLIYDDVMLDNPEFVNVQGYSLNYTDLNNNKSPDNDEYITSIRPYYIDIDTKLMNDTVFEQLSAMDTTHLNGKIEALLYFHDKLALETELVSRMATATASTAHGAIIDHVADDLGLARAMCYYAQRMGFFSFVVDEELAGEMHAWVRLKIDGKWYNIDTYYDLFLEYAVTEIPVTDEDYLCHTFFLCGDLMMFNSIGMTTTDNDPLLTSDDGTISPRENYYIEKHLKQNYYQDVALAYNALLEETEYQFSNGKDTVCLYISPSPVDDLCLRMENKYISDLNEKYGITISGYSAEYSIDCIYVTLKK